MTRKDYTLVAEIIIKQYRITGTHFLNELLNPAIQTLSAASANFDPVKFEAYVRKKLNL